MHNKRGFTLIELSIVLVIIGLIVGGVLVGQDLIKAAEVRATISQIEKTNTAVNTFRTKYNAIPGDIPVAQAAGFGLFAETTLGGDQGHGDGNYIIEGGSAAALVAIGETLSFWRHLSEANLTEGSYGIVGNSEIVATTGLPTGDVTNMAQSLPQTKMQPGGSIFAYGLSGLNYYQIVPILAIESTDGTFTHPTTGNGGMTPIQAYNIDSKIDDGAPNTGTVRAKEITDINIDASWTAASTDGDCLMGGAADDDPEDVYNRNENSGGNTPSCSLRFRFN